MICEPPEQYAGEIAEASGASRASITTNMRLPITIELEHRRTQPDERTTYHRVENDAWERAVGRKFANLAAFREVARDGMGLAGPENPRATRMRAAHESFGWMAEVPVSASERERHEE